ncbi:G protein coupled glucose receptor regulating Gpa2 protein (macronuclear) [Tetrahymena thermophila SB210]|uniref:G protein coupled glucose receptor regulating Gpa2 protein n=1 Tax=Tetrahymena thermophila (strain SB210) TaxID=312017 RepID=X1W3R2_TETTS|nr:G protein coupled glucose receptor regulating Gpa2 protein [Tetrahymena thermophila SB210]EAS06640.3 G protein coupled glucose receptor regulating Gpa2 protein [Tetrahymena thermophila SB210]|eukprot:XP_001026885.3 G protein coupled glucose receptor regulating Gpa2 protein [Tetrahymena thermophila SB210]
MAIDQTNGLIALSAVSGLSFITSLTVILVYIFNRKFRCFSHDLVIMLCASDLLYCFVALSRSIWMLSDSNAYIDGALCYIQAVYIQTFDISSCICTTSISYSLYLQMVKEVKLYKQSAFKMFWKRNYLIPFLCSLVFVVFNLVGHNDPYKETYCTVCSDNPMITQILQMIYFYIPQTVGLIFNIIMIYKVLKAYFQNRQKYRNISYSEIMKLVFYPLILLFCQIPLILIRIIEYSGQYFEDATIVLYVLSQSIGFLNSLFYAIVSLKMFGCECVSSSKYEDEDLKQRLTQRQNKNFKYIESNLSIDNQNTRAETKVLSQEDNLEWDE